MVEWLEACVGISIHENADSSNFDVEMNELGFFFVLIVGYYEYASEADRGPA